MKTFSRPQFSLYLSHFDQTLSELSLDDLKLIISTMTDAEKKSFLVFHPSFEHWKNIENVTEIDLKDFAFQRNVKAPPPNAVANPNASAGPPQGQKPPGMPEDMNAQVIQVVKALQAANPNASIAEIQAKAIEILKQNQAGQRPAATATPKQVMPVQSQSARQPVQQQRTTQQAIPQPQQQRPQPAPQQQAQLRAVPQGSAQPNQQQQNSLFHQPGPPQFQQQPQVQPMINNLFQAKTGGRKVLTGQAQLNVDQPMPQQQPQQSVLTQQQPRAVQATIPTQNWKAVSANSQLRVRFPEHQSLKNQVVAVNGYELQLNENWPFPFNSEINIIITYAKSSFELKASLKYNGQQNIIELLDYKDIIYFRDLLIVLGLV